MVDKRILITGCSGMLGDAIIPIIKSNFTHVLATDIDVNTNWLEKLDVRDNIQCQKIMSSFSPDIVFHLAALTDLEFCEKKPQEAYSTNTLGTENMAIATEQAKMPSLIEEVALPIIELIFYFTLVFWAFRLVPAIYAIVDRFDGDGEMEGTTKTLISALESIMRFFIVAFGAVLIAGSLGFDLSAILAGLGISGIALALAAKDSVSNMFGAITVLLDRPFKVGDWVVIGSSEGEVIEINFRTTQIRTSIDSVVTFPNANLVNTAIENYGLRRWRRYQPILHLDLDSNPDSVEKFCNDVFDMIQSNEKTTKKEASSVQVQSLGPQAIDIACNLYWDTSSATEEKQLKQSFLLDVMRIAKQLDLHFFEPRLRLQE